MSPEEQAADTQPPPYYASEAPDCFCTPSTPWDSRRYDGVWHEELLEQRTCLTCGASFTRELT